MSDTLTLGAGEREEIITVAMVDDNGMEEDETLKVTLSDPSGCQIENGIATGPVGRGPGPKPKPHRPGPEPGQIAPPAPAMAPKKPRG